MASGENPRRQNPIIKCQRHTDILRPTEKESEEEKEAKLMVSHTDSKLQYFSARRSRRGCDRSVLRLVVRIRLLQFTLAYYTRVMQSRKGRFAVQQQ